VWLAATVAAGWNAWPTTADVRVFLGEVMYEAFVDAGRHLEDLCSARRLLPIHRSSTRRPSCGSLRLRPNTGRATALIAARPGWLDVLPACRSRQGCRCKSGFGLETACRGYPIGWEIVPAQGVLDQTVAVSRMRKLRYELQ